MCKCGSMGGQHEEFRVLLRQLGAGESTKDKPKRPFCPVLQEDDYEECFDLEQITPKQFARNMRNGLRDYYRKRCPKDCVLHVSVRLIDLGQTCIVTTWSEDEGEAETEGRMYRVTVKVSCEPRKAQ